VADEDLIPTARSAVAAKLARASAALVLLSAFAGCGSSPPPAPAAAPIAPEEPPGPTVAPYPGDAHWDDVDVPSARMHFRLPGGAPWKRVERQGEVTLTQPATRTTVRGRLVADSDRMTRESCVARAEAEGYGAAGELVEQTVELVAGAFDGVVRVVAGESGNELVGTVVIVGAQQRRCLFTRFETRVPLAADVTLSDRLAAVRARFVPSLAVLTADAATPRELPPTPRRR
jgi:hypothetical protein